MSDGKCVPVSLSYAAASVKLFMFEAKHVGFAELGKKLVGLGAVILTPA